MHTDDLFWVWFSVSLLLAFTIERILNASITSVFWLAIPKAGLQRYASLSVVRESVSGVIDCIVSIFPIVTNLFSRWWALLVLFFLVIIGVGVQSQSSTILLNFQALYNDSVSVLLRDSFMESLRFGKIFSDPFVLLWNFSTIIVKRFFIEVILPVTRNMDVDILNLARAFFNTGKYFMVSIISYVTRLRGECDIRTGLDAVYNATSIGDKVLCFVPGTRNFDLVNPFAELRVVVAYMLVLSRRACGLMSVPLDAVSLPFLDSNMGLAVHNFVNAILYWLVSMPLTTIQRCQVSKDIGTVGWRALLFCLPDVAPGFSYLVASIRYAGRLTDNTLNLIWILILNTLNLNAPRCAPVPLSLQKPTYDSTLFGNNFTRVVGLSSHSYALTDGYSILWSSFVGQPTNVYAPYAWRLESPVDLQLGLAAVKYSSDLDEGLDVTVTGSNSDSIMGCRCHDILVETGSERTYMQIQCAIARPEPANVDAEGTVRSSMQPEYFNVSFFRTATAEYYKCAETQIVVDSARYPLWRLGLYEESGKATSLYDPLNPRSLDDGTDRNTEIDAVVWVKPLCSLEDTTDIRCIKSYPVAGDCYPACLAVRKTGSMKDGLLLRNIDDWEEGALVLNRDCSVEVTTDEVQYFEQNGVPPYNYSGMTWSVLDEENGRFFFRGSWDPTSSKCRYHPQADTFVKRGTSLTRESDIEKYDVIRLEEQPITMSGEVALFEGRDSDGNYEIIVKRLFGQQGTGFISLITLPNKLPALRPCNTPSDCDDDVAFALRLQRATIPYSTSSGEDPQGGNIAVTTRYGVIYAVNPDYSTFRAFFDYCEGKNSTDMQIIVYNSVGGLRLFKVAAFSPQGPTKSTGTYRGIINGSFADMLDISNCGRSHLLGVVSMEVIDDLNVAVTVAYGNPAVYDTRRGDVNALQLTYKVLYLNSETMATRETDLWHAEDSVASLSIGLLCPSQRVFPEFGSAVAETIASFVLMVKVLSEVIITSPATFQPGAYLDLYPPSGSLSLGHSMLMVNTGWYDVDLIFESLSRAQFLFWNTFSKLGSLFPKEPYINQFLNGVSLRYESYTPLVVDSMKSYLGSAERMSRTIDSTMTQMLQRVSGKMPIMYTGFSSGAGLVKMAQFAARTSKRWMLQVIMPSIDAIGGTGTGTTVANSLWQTVSDGFERDYIPLILNSELKACTGVRLMIGYDSPPGQLAGSICESVVYFKKGAVQVLLAFFVDIPLLHCVCQADRVGNWRTRIEQTCVKSGPLSYRGVLAAVISEEADVQIVCNKMSGHVQRKFLGAMDRFLESSFASVRIAGGAIDYMRIFWDDEAGSCSDFVEDESLTTIIPDPPDWWRVCTTTTTCRRKCLSSIESFENSRKVNNLEAATMTISSQRTVESKYFSEADVSSGHNKPPFEIEFMSEISSCVITCGISNSKGGDRCVAVGGKTKDGLYTVAEYCVPARVDSFVYLHTTWSVANSNAWSMGADVIDVSFGYQGVDSMCPYNDGAFCSLVVLFYDRLSTYREDGKEYVIARFNTPEFRDMRPDSLTVLGNSLIIVTGFSFDFETRDRTEMAICVDTRPGEVTEFGKFLPRLCNEQNVFEKGEPKINICEYSGPIGCRKLLQIPTVSALENVVFREFENNDMQSGILISPGEQWPLASGAIASAGLFQYSVIRLVGGGVIEDKVPRSRNIVVSNSVAKYQRAQVETGGTMNIFVANHPKRKLYGWLSVMRLDNKGSSIKTMSSSLQTMDIDRFVGCTLKDCRGCRDETTRTLCWAAQSCTLVRCMGTVVSLDRFLCAGGKLFLSDTMELFLQQWQAMWNLLVGLLVETISLTTTKEQSKQNVNLLSDSFLNQVCLMKDIIYDSSAFITSMINTNMNQISGLVTLATTEQSIFYPGSRVQSMVDRIDEQQAHAERTLVMASITRLLGNIGLGALYPLLIANKVMTCQGNDLVAIINAAGFNITIYDASTMELSDNIVGTCLSNYELQGVESPDTEESVLSAVVTDTIAFFGGMQYTPIKHLWDGVLSYLMSIVRGFQDVFATTFPKYCRLPDPTASQLGTCACGDQAVEIPRARAEEGLADHAFWCTGILQLSSPFGEAMYVYNPYSYSSLLDFVERDGKMAEYFACIESSSSERELSCGDLEPNLQIFEEQGVSILSVLSRCKLNYMSKQWDPGSSLIYVSELLPDYLFSQKMNVKAGETAREDYERYLKTDVELGPHANIHRCMQESVQQKTSNQGCLDEKIRSVMKDYSTFFSYSDPENELSIFRIAACESFTGPIQTLDGQDSQFHNCKHSSSITSDKTCSFPPYLWTSRSRNNVPIANQHAYGNSNRDERENTAMLDLEAMKDTVLESVREIMERWNGDVLDLGLFTSEGDTLHQAADCFMLGPYGAVELFPTDISREINTVLWSRDSTGSTRSFDLPCTGTKLNGETSPPFTCGSPARRHIIRKFVQGLEGDEETSRLRGIVNEKIIQTFQMAMNIFDVPLEDFGCQCENERAHFECCEGVGDQEAFLNTFRQMSDKERDSYVQKLLPTRLKDFNFDQVESHDITTGIVHDLYEFLNTEVWLQDMENMSSLTDVEQEVAKTDAYLRTTKTLFAFDEVMERENVSALELCVGVLSQTMFAIPVVVQSGKPTTLNTMPKWDPVTATGDEYFSALELWLQSLSSDSLKKSPLHWSHQLKQVPSTSGVCSSAGLEDIPSTFDESIEYFNSLKSDATVDFSMRSLTEVSFGTGTFSITPPSATVLNLPDPLAWTLGNLTSACFCGWDTVTDSSGHKWCEIPESVCGSAVQGTKVYEACVLRAGMYWQQGENSEVGQVVQEMGLSKEDCPWNRVDPAAWGLIEEESMKLYLQGGADESSVQLNVKDILYHGRGGFRYMNTNQLVERGRDNPLTRYFNLQNSAASIVQVHCEAVLEANLNSDAWKDRFIAEFFPTVQPVRENRVLAYCLRYTTELAFLTALETVFDTDHFVVVDQIDTVDTYRRRCLTQVKLMGFCHLRGVFDSIASSSGYHRDEACTLFANLIGYPSNGAVHVVGENCLVLHHQQCEDCSTTVYDPCNSGLCYEGEDLLFATVLSDSDPLDLSPLLTERAKAMTLHWSPPSDPHWSFNLSARQRVSDAAFGHHIGLEIDKLWHKYVLDVPTTDGLPNFGDTDAFWGTQEGKREDDSRAFCGGAPDWFPTDWEHPVGYHVSTQCSNTAWRTFANHFIYDTQLKTLEYSHSAHRTNFATHAGGSGLCRLNTYDTPVREQHNVRFCTRILDNERVDYSVPLLEDVITGGQTFGDESCSQSPYDVPWASGDRTDARFTTSALLTSWPTPDNVWPSEFLDLGLANRSGPYEWEHGDGACGMPPVFVCVSNDDCMQNVLKTGERITLEMQCLSGVCHVVADSESSESFVQCTAHHHCNEELLCSGEGKCVMPLVELANLGDEEVEFSMFSDACDETTTQKVDMRGKSPWGRIHSLLRTYGLCSYRAWYHYRTMIERCRSDESFCTLDQDSEWVDTLNPPETIYQTTSNGLMYQDAHACDREYSYSQGTRMCRPVKKEGVEKNFFIVDDARIKVNSADIRYSSLYQTYYHDDSSGRLKIQLGAMTESLQNKAFGFIDEVRNWTSLGLVPCNTVKQCSEPPFSIRGRNGIVRKVCQNNHENCRPYDLNDAISCGSFGFLTDINSEYSTCTVDLSILPMYHILCKSTTEISANCVTWNAAEKIAKCLKLTAEYPRGTSTGVHTERGQIQVVLDEMIQGVWNGSFSSLDEYNEKSRCGHYVYSWLESTAVNELDNIDYSVEDDGILHSLSTLYFFTTFSHYEIPPSFWLKCVFLSDIHLSATSSTNCDAWLGGGGRDGSALHVGQTMTFKDWLIRKVPLINLQSAVDDYAVEQQHRLNVKNRFIQSLQTVNETFRDNEVYASCYNDRRWIHKLNDEDQDCRGETENLGPLKYMVYRTLEQGSLPVQDAFQPRCCKRMDCVPSTFNGNRVRGHPAEYKKNFMADVYDTIQREDVELELVGFNENVLNENVRILDNEGTVAVPVFVQPWLDSSEKFDEMRRNLKVKLLHMDSWKTIESDKCLSNIYTLDMDSYMSSTVDTTRGCIYDGEGETDPDSLRKDTSRQYDDANIQFWRYKDQNNDIPSKVMPVCFIENSDKSRYIDKDNDLGQPCSLRYVNDEEVQFYPKNQESFTCSASDEAVGCVALGHKISNQHPERVCYHQGSSCTANFSPDEDDPATKRLHGIAKWKLPPGVKIRFYRKPPSGGSNWPFGRNPAYLRPHEKLYYNELFTDRENAERLKLEVMSRIDNQYLGAFEKTVKTGVVIPPSRRLLSFNDSERSTATPGRKLLQVGLFDTINYASAGISGDCDFWDQETITGMYLCRSLRMKDSLGVETLVGGEKGHPPPDSFASDDSLRDRRHIMDRLMNHPKEWWFCGTGHVSLEDVYNIQQYSIRLLAEQEGSVLDLSHPVYIEDANVPRHGDSGAPEYPWPLRCEATASTCNGKGYSKITTSTGGELWVQKWEWIDANNHNKKRPSCVRCKNNEVKIPGIWEIWVGAIKHETPGCYRCPNNMVAQPWQSCPAISRAIRGDDDCCTCPQGQIKDSSSATTLGAKCVPKPAEIGRPQRRPVVPFSFDVESVERMRFNPPPYLTWEVSPKDDPSGVIYSSGFTMLQSYNNKMVEKKYPPWYNCIDEDDVQNYTHLEIKNTLLHYVDSQLSYGGGLYDDFANWIEASQINYVGTPIDATLKLKLEYIAHQYHENPDLQNAWFDYDSSALPSFDAEDGSELQDIEIFRLPDNYWAFSLELYDGYKCGKNSCENEKKAIQIRDGYYYCGTCRQMAPFDRYCHGTHSCRFPTPGTLTDPDVGSTPEWQRNSYTKIKQENTDGFTFADSITLALHLSMLQYRKQWLQEETDDFLLRTNSTYLTETRPYSIDSATAWKMELPGPGAALEWEGSQGEYDDSTGELDIEKCLSDTGFAALNRISYRVCQNDHKINALKRIVDDLYTRSGVPVIQPQYSMILPLSAIQLKTARTVFSWAQAKRTGKEQFISYLLDSERECLKADRLTSVCRVEAGRLELFNPWVGGDISLRNGCDIAPDILPELISTRCLNGNECPTEDTNTPFYRYQVPGCKEQDGELARRLVGRGICGIRPSENPDQCTHNQGILGGGKGSPQINLYDYSDVVSFDGTDTGGVFTTPRRLFYSQREFLESVGISKRTFHVHEKDIGSHFVFALQDEVLKLVDVVLSGSASTVLAREEEATLVNRFKDYLHDLDWMEWDEVAEDRHAREIEPDLPTTSRHWACPIKQRIYLSGLNDAFRPLMPNPRRAQIMFEAHHGGFRSSTVQKLGEHTSVFRSNVVTPNGNCFCTNPDDCIDTIFDESPCTFGDTFRSLMDSEWRSSKSRTYTTCKRQYDWPLTGGKLRDGTFVSSSSTDEQSDEQCYLLDRLHDFKYRYKTVDAMQNSDAESNLRSGDCRTARASGTPDSTWNPAEVRRCSECQPRPSFTAGGQSIPSETSFGIPYRISSSRIIAEELKSKLRHGICGSNEPCEQYLSLLNVSLFVPDRFWGAFWNDSEALLYPDVLYPKRNITSIYDKLEMAETDLSIEDDLWDIPWIYCDKIIPECREHCTAENNCVTLCDANNTKGSCIGSMNRETWLDPKQRQESCLNEILEAGNSKPSTFSMNLCDVDTLTDEFCKVIANAKQDIFEINCQISGICTREAFFYTPSVFSIANGEFVRDTVESFYLRMDVDSCPQRDTESAAIQASNQDLLYKCPATAMQTLYNLLDSLRAIIELLIRIMYYSNLMFLNMLRLIFLGADASDSAAASAEVWKYFQLLIDAAGDLLKEFAEMLIEMILYNSTMGPVLMHIIELMCWFIHEWQKFMLKIVACSLVNAGIDFLNSIAYLVDVADALEWMYIMKQETCYVQPIDCNFTDPFGGDFVLPYSLPVATRCWSSYVSRYGGGENSLSCSAADTCYAKDLATFGEDPLPGSTAAGLLACDACPTPTDFTESRFGCDLFTRSCKCGVRNIRKTTCINNHECSVAADSTCQVLDSLLNADPYGILSCSACTGLKVCLVDPMSNGVGYCACSREHIAPLSCGRAEVGQTYQTGAGTMCYAAVGLAVRDGITEQVSPKISAYSLALSRCDLLNPSARRCSFVEFANGETGFYVVGSKTVSQGRRLLSDDSLIPRFDFALPPQALDDAEAREGWESVQSEICRFVPLLQENNASLGISDRYHLRHCIRWRAIAFEVLTQLDLQNKIPDTFLLGLHDFSVDILSHPSRIALLTVNPSILLLSFLHSEMMTPVRSMLRSLRQFVAHVSVEIEGARLHVQTSNVSFETNMSRSQIQQALYAIGVGKSVARHLVNNLWWTRVWNTNATLQQTASEFNKSTNNVTQYFIRSLHTVPVFSSNHRRKLLQTNDFAQRLEDVSDFSKEIALGNGDLQILGTAAATAYTQGPSTWPSEFKYWEQDSACALVSNFAELVSKSGTLAARSMKNISNTEIDVSYDIIDALAKVLSAPAQQLSDMQRIAETKNKLPWYLQFIVTWGEQLGLDFGYFARLLSKAPNMLYDLVSCDIEAVILCQKHQYSLVTSSIVATIILSVVGVLSSLVGLPTIPLIFSVISFWSIVMYVSFGYSPMCFPLIPQCAATSLIKDMERLLPTRFEIPPALVTCNLDQATTPPPNCIAECENEPFGFRDFYDNIVFSVCQASLPLCARLESWIFQYQNLLTDAFGNDFVEALLHSVLRSTVILHGDTNMITASSWCNVMTFYKALPVLLLATVGLSIVPVFIGILFRIFAVWVRVGIASFQMTHVES